MFFYWSSKMEWSILLSDMCQSGNGNTWLGQKCRLGCHTLTSLDWFRHPTLGDKSLSCTCKQSNSIRQCFCWIFLFPLPYHLFSLPCNFSLLEAYLRAMWWLCVELHNVLYPLFPILSIQNVPGIALGSVWKCFVIIQVLIKGRSNVIRYKREENYMDHFLILV